MEMKGFRRTEERLNLCSVLERYSDLFTLSLSHTRTNTHTEVVTHVPIYAYTLFQDASSHTSTLVDTTIFL